MREIRKSGSEGGVGFNPPFLPLSIWPGSWKLRLLYGLGAGSSGYYMAWELEAPATIWPGSWKLRLLYGQKTERDLPLYAARESDKSVASTG